MNTCPYSPSSKKFSLRRCSVCRATTSLGYTCRKMVADVAKSLNLEFPERGDGCFYNYKCESFQWNFDRSETGFHLGGQGPLTPEDCEFYIGGICSKLGKSIETGVSLKAGKVKLGGEIPICELCLTSPKYSKQIEKKK